MVSSGDTVSATASKKTPANKYAALNEAMREEQFELLCRLRIMLMMDVKDGKMSLRVKEDVACMLEIRLAALATYLYLTSEDKAQTELFLYEPNMVAQLADLVNPNSKVSDRIVAPAFMALDACAHYRYKCTEVVAALNANVAHGTLMNCYREIIKRLGTDQGAPHELVDSVLSFVAFLAASSGYGNMLVGAGIIPLIIDLIKVEHPARGGYVARAMGLIDNMMYTSNNAFNIFCNANGLQTLNHRITVEVDRLISGEYAQSIATESDLLRRTTPLKLMLRSVHRLMQASGTVDALRNLIDSELPKSLLKIFNNVDKMGASVFALAIHVTAAFVHNEPTSLSILQEMKLPDALYDALERNRQASFEILSAVPNAVGPDSLRTETRSIQLDTGDHLSLTFASSVLALRGDHVAAQPLVDEETGNILCWNGQVLEGLNASLEQNDTEVLFRTLNTEIELARRTQVDQADRLVVDVFAKIEGPYAFVYYDRYTETIYFARDVFGRRSLLIPESANHAVETRGSNKTIPAFTLASVAPPAADRKSPLEELDCRWIWALDLRHVIVDAGEINVSSAIRKLGRLPSGNASSIFAKIPSLNRMIPTTEDAVEEGYPKTLQAHVQAFVESVADSVRRRVENIPPPTREGCALTIAHSSPTSPTNTFPAGEPIDLLNVAFENPRAIANATWERAERQRLAAKRKQKGKEKATDAQETEEPCAGVYDVPDRMTGRETVAELRRIHPEREWRFVEIDVEYQGSGRLICSSAFQECQAARPKVLDLMYPSDTEMDLSLALPLWFAARRKGCLRNAPDELLVEYQSRARVLLSGLGADELLGGYARHRRAFEINSWQGAIDEVGALPSSSRGRIRNVNSRDTQMQMDLDRLPFRNLGRDDRVISSHGVETRYPYLSLSVAQTLAGLPINAKCDLRYPEGVGDKSLIRIAAHKAGLVGAASKKKRAMQFGTRSARMEPEEKGTKQRGMGAQKITA
ncbi:hypothetical protein QFC20_007546 [Naganishia adeliensis]|uniref:Uncharacterized protein n=1 Tax=Naganishia adeliensis TaxID=92952 RepID=A0ACC2UYS3_9TREE|nr:hypothetical protein QFC20_007546 [Naganishia adeliensis]